SRFRASQALLKEFAQAAVKYDPFETIILRDADGNPIDYRDNRETRRMRKNLAALNEALLSQQIGLGDQVIREGERIENGGRAELQMHRVFVRGRWDNCGRFVGPLWQSRPKTERQGLTINGLATEELDFKGMHIQLLYQEAGKQMQGDPYNVDGWPRERV